MAAVPRQLRRRPRLIGIAAPDPPPDPRPWTRRRAQGRVTTVPEYAGRSDIPAAEDNAGGSGGSTVPS
ncbi:hypothetical protein Voc01_098350 [Virgisporangium ochraceum]|uniref:Uncharacterized protein n=1 Tax=Virgisporangium ochraceum TaxID=65505 RepID=A0A8J4A646_9ACTN|nr:hypothetical protein Voc01_098350 [Virgisporangium ochraceum]